MEDFFNKTIGGAIGALTALTMHHFIDHKYLEERRDDLACEVKCLKTSRQFEVRTGNFCYCTPDMIKMKLRED